MRHHTLRQLIIVKVFLWRTFKKMALSSDAIEFPDSSSCSAIKMIFSPSFQTSPLVCSWALAYQAFIYRARRWLIALHKTRTFGAWTKNSNESFLYFPFLYLSFFCVLPFCWAQPKPCPRVLTKSLNWIKSFTWMKRSERGELTDRGRAERMSLTSAVFVRRT